jgi:sigma-B regulation protein RsbU (phosphoserine phosphatase)
MSQPTRRLSLGFWLPGLGLLSTALLAVLLTASIYALRSARTASDLTAREQATRFATRELRAALVDAETGQRGFLLTGRDGYLEPYHRALQSLPLRFAELGSLTPESGLQRTRLNRVEGLASAKLAELGRTIELRQKSGLEAALQAVNDNFGKQTMDELREVTAQMDRDEQREVESHAAGERSLGNKLLLCVLLSGGALVLIGAGALAGSAEQRRNKAQLASNEARLKAIVQQLPAGVVVAHASGVLEFANAKAKAIVGHLHLKAGSLPDFRNYGAIHPDGRPFALGEYPMARALTGQSVVAEEVLYRRPDGTTLTLLVNAGPVKDPQGRLQAAVSSFVDISELKAVQASAQRAQDLLDHAPAVIYAKSVEGKFVLVNRRFEALFGVSRVQAVGHSPFEVLPRHIAVELQASHARVVETGRFLESEELVQQLDGPHTYLSAKFPLHDRNGRVYAVCGISTDISERKRAEEFEQRLLGIVGHDLRSPLTAVIASAALLLRQGSLTEPQLRTVKRIARGGERIQLLAGTVLDFTRARSGEAMPLHREKVVFGQIGARVLEELEAQYPGRELRADFSGDTAGWWDPERLVQLVTILVKNALEHGSPGAPVDCSCHDDGDFVLLTVHNAGEPISSGLREHLFEPFRRGDQTETTVKLSVGLGLYLAREIVLAHRGTIDVISSLQQGTAFTIRLPRRPITAVFAAEQPVQAEG